MKSGDEITSVTVNGEEDNVALNNFKNQGYLILEGAGLYQIAVTAKNSANQKTTTKSITVHNYETVKVQAADSQGAPIGIIYGDSLEAKDLYRILPGKGQKDQYRDGEATTQYIVSDADSADQVKNSFANATPGLPKDAGSYWVKTILPNPGYFLGNSVYTKVEIHPEKKKTVFYNNVVTMQEGDTTGKTIDLSNILQDYRSSEDTQLTYEVKKIMSFVRLLTTRWFFPSAMSQRLIIPAMESVNFLSRMMTNEISGIKHFSRKGNIMI